MIASKHTMGKGKESSSSKNITMTTDTVLDQKVTDSDSITVVSSSNEDERPRRVHFALDGCVGNASPTLHREKVPGPLLVPSSELKEEEKQQRWWQSKDYDRFLGHSQLLATETRRRENGDPLGYTNTLLNAYNGCINADGPTTEQRHYMAQWTNVAFSRRGLERFCVPKLAHIRQTKKSVNLQAVVILSKQQRMSSKMTSDERADCIFKLSEKLSRPARLFAAVVGEADEFAARLKDGEDKKSLPNTTAATKVKLQVTTSAVVPVNARPAILKTNSFCRILRRRRSFPTGCLTEQQSGNKRFCSL
jgi:hypothetical protein